MRKLWSVLLVICIVATGFQVKSVKAEEENYNYGEALQKAIMFYEFQRSGDLPEGMRNNWRGDSGLTDGSDVNLDLTGGWYDAGDHVKFNLPMAYTATMLAWSVYESEDALSRGGQLEYLLQEIRGTLDYLMKCHPKDDVFYYQVGSGNTDHSWWGPAEVMQMERPSYKVDISNPGSTVCAEAAAALAAGGAIFANRDPAYSASCIKHARQLFSFADRTKSDSGYTAAREFYNSHSGFYDELCWSGVWLYIATGEKAYLDKAESYVPSKASYSWAQNWDDVHYGAELLLAKLTNKDIYKSRTEMHLDYWSVGYNGNRVAYTPKGLAWLDTWGSLRYSTTTAFLASVYADWTGCSSDKAKVYKEFARNQIDYALGSSGRSYVVGYGTNAPEHPHHRTSHSSWTDSRSNPSYHRHTLYGALVGGPAKDDSYTDSIDNYVNNEVACDYNAGFVGALAKMYEDYGGEPIEGFTANETPTNDEFYVEAGTIASGSNFIEVDAYLNNRSGWPARMGDKLSFKYFVDISEAVNAGYAATDFTVTTNRNEGATVSKLIPWDTSRNLYYVNVDFTGTKIYPGGNSAYRKEIQFRITAPSNQLDSSNDFSYTDLKGVSSGSLVKTSYIPVYDEGTKVYGYEPGNMENSSSILPTGVTFDRSKPSDVSVAITYNGNSLTTVSNESMVLTAGTDYTVSGEGVTFLKSYLATLPMGQTKFTFDFSKGNDPVLTVSVMDSSVVVTGNVKVQMFNGSTSGETNGISPKLKVMNTGTEGIALSDVKLRYYYTIDGEKAQNYWVDWAAVGSGNVTAKFVKMDVPREGADYYLEIGFTSGAGVLAAGQTTEMQVRFAKSDWTNYTQTGDYSFRSIGSSYSEWDRVTAYLDSQLVWGIEPN